MHVPGLPVSYVYDGEVWPFGIVVGVNAVTSLVTVFVLHEVNGYKPGYVVENMEMGKDLVLDVTAAVKLVAALDVTAAVKLNAGFEHAARSHRPTPLFDTGDVDGFGGEDLPLSPRMRA